MKVKDLHVNSWLFLLNFSLMWKKEKWKFYAPIFASLIIRLYGLPFRFSGKVLPVILILLFFSFILYMPARLYLSDPNKKSFKSKNSLGRECCKLKVLKVLLIHLFVTTGSNNRHFFFNTLEKENKEEFLTYSTFCTLEQIEENILRKRLF